MHMFQTTFIVAASVHLHTVCPAYYCDSGSFVTTV